MSENQARIVVDNKNNKQLQLEVDTLIEDNKRREVLLYTSLKSVIDLEYEISKMAASRIEVMYEAIMNDKEVADQSANGQEPASLIILPSDIKGEPV